jgi:DNA-binding transcriptional ArsR family regulator
MRWSELEEIVTALGLPDRAIGPLFNASLGLRLRNQAYRADADVSEQVASRDLRQLVDAGLLETRGERRGRTYVRSPRLIALDDEIRRRRPARVSDDPFDLARAAVEQQRLWPGAALNEESSTPS